jgi:ribonuclease Z
LPGFREIIVAYLHLLGTGSAVSDAHRTTTMLAVENEKGVVAVDCGGDLVQRLLQVRIDLDRIEAVIITHGHPDHVSGFPLLMQKLWLHGRTRPLTVIGPGAALSIARSLWDVFGLEDEQGMPEIRWVDVGTPEQPGTLHLDTWECTYGPASHGPVTIGLRFRDPTTGAILAYSSDTAPDPRIAALARDADILVHEATGHGPGHSSVLDAAQTAKEAGAKRLLLVHLPPIHTITEESIRDGRNCFAWLELGEEGKTYSLPDG